MSKPQTIIFPSEPFSPRKPEPDFETEVQAAREAGFEVAFYDLEEARLGTPVSSGPCLYRGWMMSLPAYHRFAQHLATRGLELLTSPVEYELCHHLPGWYPALESVTAESRWCPADTPPAQWPLEDFGDSALIVKDYVKSEKHAWKEACYIPHPSKAEPIVQRFLELRDSFLEGGLVFRRFLEFEHLTHHSKSGMPLSLEYRLFFWKGRLLAHRPTWEGTYPNVELPEETFCELASRIDSPFFTMDVARGTDGRWWVVELGDGQVAGLPETLRPSDFYSRL